MKGSMKRKIRVLMAATAIAFTSTSALATEPAQEMLRIVTQIDNANRAYSQAMMEFALAMPDSTDEVAAFGPEYQALLLAWTDRMIELSVAMYSFCGEIQAAGLGDLLAQTRCGGISDDRAFIELWRSAAVGGR